MAAIYIRETPSDDSEDDEWGDDLVNGMFTLKNGENAVYYYEKGTSSATYDIRITYSDEEKNECFFRKLPTENYEADPHFAWTEAAMTQSHMQLI